MGHYVHVGAGQHKRWLTSKRKLLAYQEADRGERLQSAVLPKTSPPRVIAMGRVLSVAEEMATCACAETQHKFNSSLPVAHRFHAAIQLPRSHLTSMDVHATATPPSRPSPIVKSVQQIR